MGKLSKKKETALIEAVARREGVPAEKVRWEIEKAIDFTMASGDETKLAALAEMVGHAGRPTLGEFLGGIIDSTAKGAKE